MRSIVLKSCRRTAAILTATVAVGCSKPGPAAEVACSLAFDHVTVVSMKSDRIALDQTVRIDGDRILSITPARRSASDCARAIDGHGMFLAPGLNDLHVHVESQMFQQVFGTPPEPLPFEDLLFPYLANGVTGIRIMSGAPDLLAFRRSPHGPVPRLSIASPMLSGEPPIMPEPITRVLTTPDQALAAVDEFAARGYDFIKVRENLAPDVLDAVMRAAARNGLYVDGHLPRSSDPFSAGRRGIAHVDELSLRVEDHERDPAALVARVKACDCFVTTTLSIEQNVAAQLRDYARVAARPESRYVHPLLRTALWDRARNPYLAEGQDPAFFDGLLRADEALIRELRRQQVPILAGTDALVPMIVPGFSLHDELALLVESGLTPYEALSAATRTPSEVLPQFRDVGVIEAGQIANLVLLAANPLADIAVLRRPEAVIVEGRYLDRIAIDRRLAEIAQSFAAP